jgi:hypothetical protein
VSSSLIAMDHADSSGYNGTVKQVPQVVAQPQPTAKPIVPLSTIMPSSSPIAGTNSSYSYQIPPVETPTSSQPAVAAQPVQVVPVVTSESDEASDLLRFLLFTVVMLAVCLIGVLIGVRGARFLGLDSDGIAGARKSSLNQNGESYTAAIARRKEKAKTMPHSTMSKTVKLITEAERDEGSTASELETNGDKSKGAKTQRKFQKSKTTGAPETEHHPQADGAGVSL